MRKNLRIVLFVLLMGSVLCPLRAQQHAKAVRAACANIERAVFAATLEERNSARQAYRVNLSWRLTEIKEYRRRVRIGGNKAAIRLPVLFGNHKTVEKTCSGYLKEGRIFVSASCAKPEKRENYALTLLAATAFRSALGAADGNANVEKYKLGGGSQSADGKYLVFSMDENGRSFSGK